MASSQPGFRPFLSGVSLIASTPRKDTAICYTCGCKLPYEAHGDPANLIEDDLKAAGQTETIERAGVKTAKENMLELLQLQQEEGNLDRPRQDYND
jgi:hypothetical protein